MPVVRFSCAPSANFHVGLTSDHDWSCRVLNAVLILAEYTPAATDRGLRNRHLCRNVWGIDPIAAAAPHPDALQIPFGRVFAVTGIIITVGVLTRLHGRQALLMGVTALIATANWWWAKRREIQTQNVSEAVVAAGVSD